MEALPQEDEVWADLYAIYEAAMRGDGRWPSPWTPRLVQYTVAPERKHLIEDGDREPGAIRARCYLLRFEERGLLRRVEARLAGWGDYRLAEAQIDILFERFADKVRERALAKLTPRERKALGLEPT